MRTILGTAASARPKPLIPYNPAHIRGAGNTKRVHKVRPASLEELPDRYKLMALLAAWCAMRFGELAELRRGDIDLRTNRVSITRGVVRVDGNMIIGPPKSDAGVRDVAIPPHLIPVVKAHLMNHLKNPGPAGERCCSPPPPTARRTWRRRRCTRSTTRPGRRPAATTCAGTTSATRGRCWPPRPARRSPN